MIANLDNETLGLILRAGKTAALVRIKDSDRSKGKKQQVVTGGAVSINRDFDSCIHWRVFLLGEQ